MKKRNKKRNPQKLKKLMFDSQSPDIIANSAIYQLPGGKCEFLSLNNKPMNIDALRRVYCDMPHRWSVMVIVFRVKPSGAKGLSVHHLRPPFEVMADQIAESVEEKHNEMIIKCPVEEFLCPAWIAVPRDELISSVRIEEIFDGLGVWRDYITDNGYVLFEERNQLSDNIKG